MPQQQAVALPQVEQFRLLDPRVPLWLQADQELLVPVAAQEAPDSELSSEPQLRHLVQLPRQALQVVARETKARNVQ